MKTDPKDLFVRAHELSGDAREAYLQEACGEDAELRLEVQRLLVKAEKFDSFFCDDGGATIASDSFDAPFTEDEGDVIGPYTLRQQIGEGGFGAVWMAEQTGAISRMVALKVVKAGMDTRQVLSRFEAERQALAMMDHPNIARILDAGATPAGRPYFAMELVKGIPITDFCREQKLDTRERLALFQDVCSAINHAHQKGIIHRDLKPSNIMVTLEADQPVAKVIDFGIAKATQDKLTDQTLFTRFEQFLGTPAYMSPEQAAMSNLDIDTRSDIYSLGVLLYELLAGAPPFDSKSLLSAGYDEMRRIIKEDEPPKPSTRLTQSLSSQSSNSANSRISPHALRGDLDRIVMKAIDKDRTRRYETANAFSTDIGRFLADEPVLAAAPSVAYKLRKFTKRNRGLVSAGLIVSAVLLFGVIGTSIGMLQAQREASDRRLSERNERQARELAEARGETLGEQTYFQLIHLAERELKDGRPAAARRLLEECPPGRREHWEWHYLNRLSYSDRLEPVKTPLPGMIRDCVWSPTSSDVAVVLTQDGTLTEVTVRDSRVETRSLLQLPTGLPIWVGLYGVGKLSFSPQGDRVALATGGEFMVIELATGEVLDRQEGAFIHAMFDPDPDSPLLTALEFQAGLQVWDLDRDQIHEDLGRPQEGRGYYSICKSPDGRWLAAGTNLGAIELWEISGGTHRHIHTLNHHFGPIFDLAISADSKQLASGGVDHKVVVWNLDSAEVEREFLGHTGVISGVSIGAGRIASTDHEGNLRVWHTRTGSQIFSRTGHYLTNHGAEFCPEGERLLVQAGLNQLGILDGRDGDDTRNPGPLHSFDHEAGVLDVTFLEDDRRILALGEQGVRIWDLDTRREHLTNAPGRIGRGIGLFPDGNSVATAHWEDGWRIWELESGKLLRGAQPSRGTRNLSLSADGRWMATIETMGLWVWNLEQGDSGPVQLGDHDNVANDVEFSQCGRYLIASKIEEVTLWEVDQLQSNPVGRPLTNHGAGVSWQISISPDGEYVALGRQDGSLLIVPTAKEADREGAPDRPWKASEYPVNCVAYSPDGRFLATGGADETVRIWRLADRKLLRVFVPGTKVFCLAFSSDGRWLASGSHGKRVDVWDTRFLQID